MKASIIGLLVGVQAMLFAAHANASDGESYASRVGYQEAHVPSVHCYVDGEST